MPRHQGTTPCLTDTKQADGQDLSSGTANGDVPSATRSSRDQQGVAPISGVWMSIRPSNPARSRMSSVVQRHPLACFFVLTYVAAWCLWAPLLILRDTLPPAVAFILVLLGSLVPSTIAIVLVAILHGNRGVRSLLGRLVKWRVGFRWYAVVLILPLLAPLGLGVSILLGGRAPTVDSSVIAVLVGFVFSIFPGSALGEELGWRGFALPHLQDGHSALAAALIVGPLWGCYHLPLWLTGNESHPIILFPAFVLSAIALSVLLAWIYNSTAGSLLLVVLFHATANLPVTFLIAPLGIDMIQPFLIFTALLIVAAAAVVGFAGTADLSRTQRKQTSEDIPTAPVAARSCTT
jgi:membrane protease YdiL (CAAX protease family)